jgi:hypothetical protein
MSKVDRGDSGAGCAGLCHLWARFPELGEAWKSRIQRIMEELEKEDEEQDV